MSTEGLPLTLALCEAIEDRMRLLRAAWGVQAPSEYAFSNLYLFRGAHAYRYFPGPLPHVTGLTYDGARHVLPLFDPRHVAWQDLAGLLGDDGCLFPMPELVLAELDGNEFCWGDAEADADYVYPAENFRSYRGTLLRKKRNLMRQLLATHQITVRPLAADTEADALAIHDAWLRDKRKQPGEADDGACREAIRLRTHFGMEGQVYYADGSPAGFLLAQPFVSSVAVMRFAKGDDRYKGIYQYMFHHYCTAAGNLQWLNFEQDLGLPNFRQTKRSYQPAAMLRKFRVRLRA